MLKSLAMETSISSSIMEQLLAKLSAEQTSYEVNLSQRQPIHTLYGGGDRFKSDSIPKLSKIALKTFKDYGKDGKHLNASLGLKLSDNDAENLFQKLKSKLENEAIEDLRIDFEDGFGFRSDAEEDAHAQQAAQALAQAQAEENLSPFIGLRVKSLNSESAKRALRTLDIFLNSYKNADADQLPDNFAVTLPKITSADQLKVMIEALTILEEKLSFPVIPLELVIESPEALINKNGTISLPEYIAIGGQRLRSIHFGTYDYLSSTKINSVHANHDHPNADFARQIMQICASQSHVTVSDSITNILPIPPNKGEISELSEKQKEENAKAVIGAWQVHFENIQRSIKHGYFQGWDLHPNQLAARYAAMYHYFISNIQESTERLNNFIDKATRATVVGTTFDDAATGQVLLNFFLQGRACGALDDSDLSHLLISEEELNSRSFKTIIENR